MSEFFGEPNEMTARVRVPVVVAKCDNPDSVVPGMIQMLSTLSRSWEPAQMRFVVSAGGEEKPAAQWQVDAADLDTAMQVATNLRTIANAVLVDMRLGDPTPAAATESDPTPTDEPDVDVPIADFVASRRARVDYVRVLSSAWRAAREDTVRWTLTVALDALLAPLVDDDRPDDAPSKDTVYPETPTPSTAPTGVRLVGARVRLSSRGESPAASAITALFSEDTVGAYGLQDVPVAGASAPLTWLPVNLAAHLLSAPARMFNAFPAPAVPREELFGLFETAATPHVLVLGSSGQGKTVFLSHLVHRACERQEASCVVDVHDGWLFGQAVSFARQHGLKPVVVDFSNPAKAPRISLSTPPPGLDRRKWADELWDIVRHLIWSDMPAEYFGPVGERGVKALIRMAILDPLGITDLADVAAIITEPSPGTRRRELLERIGDPELTGVIENEVLPMLRSRDPGNSATFLLSKISPLTDSWALRSRQDAKPGKGDTLGVERAVKAGQPFFIYAPTTVLGDSGSRLVVSIALHRLWLAARAQRKPKPMHVMVDEWQLYPSTTIGAMLSQGRKYGLRMRLANQNLAQLSTSLRESVLGNSGSIVCFRVGPNDAALLDGLFPQIPRQRLQSLPPHTFAVTFGDRDLITAAPPPLAD